MDLSLIIISYNTKELTLSCLRSVFKETRKIDFEVILVDNASSDNSAQAISKQFPEVKLIRSEKNLGFAGANNLAAKSALGKYLLLLNPDTVIFDRAIEKVFDFAEKISDWGILGGQSFFANMTQNPTSGWMKPSIWSLFCISTGLSRLFHHSRLFNPESLAGWKWNACFEVDIVTGCFLLISKTNWKMLKGFDKQFFMYGEDADLCMRASSLGLKSKLIPDVKFIHYGGASEPVRADKMIRLLKAKVQLFRIHYGNIKSRIMIILLRKWCITRISMFWTVSIFKQKYKKKYSEWPTIWNSRRMWLN